MKKADIILTFFAFFSLINYLTVIKGAPTKPVKFTSNCAHIIQQIDGSSLGVDAEIIKAMVYIRGQLNQRLFGKIVRNVQRTGFYTFNDTSYSINDLVKLEKSLQASNKRSATPSKETLQTWLDEIKIDIIQITKPWMDQARAMKSFTVPLIEESCIKRNRPDSYLRVWSKLSEGQEEESFKRLMTSFEQVSEFCQDLVNFLADMIYNTPKAFKQFKAKYLKK